MSNGFLVCKVTVSDIIVMIDGTHRSIPRESADSQRILNLVREYNDERDPQKRIAIKAEVGGLMNPAKRIELATDNRFEFDGNKNMYLKGTDIPIPNILAKKFIQFINENLPIEAMVNFWMHLLLNPDTAVREQLYGFIEHRDIAITQRGYLVCAKAVAVKRKYDKLTGEKIIVKEYDEEIGELIKEEYTHDMTFEPYHSGDHGMIIKMGQAVTMPREKCDNNPHQTCSAGLHVGSIEYVRDFGREDGVILEVLVSPRHVVAVPVKFAA